MNDAFSPHTRPPFSRRRFLAVGAGLAAQAAVGGLSAVVSLGHSRAAQAAESAFNPSPVNGWRSFEITSRIELAAGSGAAKVWIPLPSVSVDDWIKPLGDSWQGNAASMREAADPVYGARMLLAEWSAGEPAPVVEVVSRFSARDRSIDFSKPGGVKPLSAAERKLWTQPTELLPTDGIVRLTAIEATRGANTDLEKARALYEWVVDNTQRNPKTKGCGAGDIRAMLQIGDLTGKCADLNALYVGMARSLGLPARDVYGVRVTESRFGYMSLGKGGDISKGQHCRAEVWLEAYGWVPVDPADVRKVVLEEKPGLTLNDELVVAAREKLFGAWEMNWLAYNFAHDVSLPGSSGKPVGYLMYPQGETATGRLDSLDPAGFSYRISSREITA